jgi:aerobic C4-dicarboxylate transport protein
LGNAQALGKSRPWYTILYAQVLIAVVIGSLIGGFFPKTGMALKPLGDAFR